MVYKAVGNRGELPFGGPVTHIVATADGPLGPFEKHPEPVFTNPVTMFPAEDPFVWFQDGQYRAVVKDMGGHFTGAGMSLALFESADGFQWKPAASPLVSTVGLYREDGRWEPLARLERPQVWLENDRPVVLFCAALNTEKDGSFNVAIPLSRSAG